MEDRWPSVEEISTYLGVRQDTVYAWVLARSLPAHRAGRLWKSERDKVDKWIRSGWPTHKSSNEEQGSITRP